MVRNTDAPIKFALSNPTEHGECNAEQAYPWSKDKVLFAAGIPFDPVEYQGQKFYPGQANNYYCFPGVSLGIYAAHPRLVTDAIWIEAAKTLADLLTDDEKAKGMVFPPQSDILNISFSIGTRVAAKIFEQGLTKIKKPDNIEEWVKGMLYNPEY